MSYKEYLEKIAKLTKEATMPGGGPGGYPASVKTAAQRALYNNLGKDEGLALAVDAAIQGSAQDGWRDQPHQDQEGADRDQGRPGSGRPRGAARSAWQPTRTWPRATYPEADTDRILDLAKHQNDY